MSVQKGKRPMKISLAKLEILRQDPIAFKAAMDTPYIGGYSMFQALQHSALHYHKTKDCREARKHLREQFGKHFTSKRGRRTLLNYIAQLDEYVVRFEERKFRYNKSYYNIALDLPPSIHSTTSCTGQIPLLSFKAALSQWDALFYSENRLIARNQLRLPLIQKQIAIQMQSEIDDVSVSFYHFLSGNFTTFQFCQSEIDSAQTELENLIAQII